MGDIRTYRHTQAKVEIICEVPGHPGHLVVRWLNTEHREYPFAVVAEEWLA